MLIGREFPFWKTNKARVLILYVSSKLQSNFKETVISFILKTEQLENLRQLYTDKGLVVCFILILVRTLSSS